MVKHVTTLSLIAALGLTIGCVDEFEQDEKLPRADWLKDQPCDPFACEQGNGNKNLGNLLNAMYTEVGSSTGVWTINDALLPNGESASLKAGWDTLVMLDASGVQHQAAELVGAVLLLTLHAPGGDQAVTITIVDHGTTPHHVYNDPVNMFQMKFGGGAIDGMVCDDLSLNPDGDIWVVIAPDDYFNDQTYTIEHVGPQIFNIACRGSIAGKIKLAGRGKRDPYVTSANAPGSMKDPVESTKSAQAMMKMLAGDFCGSGESLTEQGTPLAWQDTEGTIDTSGGVQARESYWDESGASCLDVHRLAWDISPHCALPACTDPPLNTRWTSINQ